MCIIQLKDFKMPNILRPAFPGLEKLGVTWSCKAAHPHWYCVLRTVRLGCLPRKYQPCITAGSWGSYSAQWFLPCGPSSATPTSPRTCQKCRLKGSTGNYIQYLGITYNGKEYEKRYVCVCLCVCVRTCVYVYS